MRQDTAPLMYRTCATHWFDNSVATCRDCHAEVCELCVVPVGKLGTFCRHCAMVRAGVRARRRGAA